MRMCNVALIALLLGGCLRPISGPNISKALELCEPNGGLKSIAVDIGQHIVRCNNDALFYVQRGEL